jgi:hypothetical protein
MQPAPARVKWRIGNSLSWSLPPMSEARIPDLPLNGSGHGADRNFLLSAMAIACTDRIMIGTQNQSRQH